ncbi:MAG: FAD-dependent oxidoreductase [Deltaproteobacteria bacterium]|nr:FAD-dependent oxidoreductase [Deltaproteobacteria bacterium]
MAIGSWTPGALKIPGAELEGVYYALPLLEEIKKGKPIALGKRVVVIGGGNTAMDVARAAVRLGAKEVQVTCLESRKTMPAHPWEIENTIREGAKIHPSLAPQQLRNNGKGRVAGVDCQQVASCQVDSYGSLSWTLQECAGSELSLDADSVVIAIGQTPFLASLGANGKVKLTPRKTLAVDPETLACGTPGLFAAGDAVVGASPRKKRLPSRKHSNASGRPLMWTSRRNGPGSSCPLFPLRKQLPLFGKSIWGLPPKPAGRKRPGVSTAPPSASRGRRSPRSCIIPAG